MLAKHLDSGAKIEDWVGLNLDRFLSHGKVASNPQRGDVKQMRAHYDSLFAERDFDPRSVLSVGDVFEYLQRHKSLNDEGTFSSALVQKLLDRLESNPPPHLTPNEQAHLSALIEATLEVGTKPPPFILSLIVVMARLKNNDGR